MFLKKIISRQDFNKISKSSRTLDLNENESENEHEENQPTSLH